MVTPMSSSEKCLNSRLWNACAGALFRLPDVNSTVVYFPQGHAEHAVSAVDFGPLLPRIPPLVLCRVDSVKPSADPETDELYVRMRLIPVEPSSFYAFDDGGESPASDSGERLQPFVKVLTQSDANNGGGFSVRRNCAESIFPPLDYKADPPVQTLSATDIHGTVWNFRHIYRGTPRRHLLTTGWSNFVNQKKLVAGDAVVFLRDENGHLCIGIQRARRDSAAAWIYDKKAASENGKVDPDAVFESAASAADGRPFEVVYYPRAGTPEFCVKSSTVKASMRTNWCAGMRFKMPLENEDSSQITWFSGTISNVHYSDPKWPYSPWKLLQVTWDEEPDSCEDLRRVSPWMIEVVSSMSFLPVSPSSSPLKKLRVLHSTGFLPIDGPPSFSVDPPPVFRSNAAAACCLIRPSEEVTATPGIQGTRQLTTDELMRTEVLDNKSSCVTDENNEDGSPEGKKEEVGRRGANAPAFFLFGQPILTQEQMSAPPADREPPGTGPLSF